MAVLTNAERQAAYRARRRNGVTPKLVQAAEVTEWPMDRAAQQFYWGRRVAAKTLNPYQLHIMRVRYGGDWVRQCVTA